MPRPRKKVEDMTFPELIVFSKEMKARVAEIESLLVKILPLVNTVAEMAAHTSAAMDRVWLANFGAQQKKPHPKFKLGGGK